MSRRALTCRELIEFLGDYVEDALAREERAVFDHHLSICPDCVNYLDSYRQTRRLGREAFASDDAVPDEVPSELVDAILAARRRS
jgi:anti-sigma factor RsiW